VVSFSVFGAVPVARVNTCKKFSAVGTGFFLRFRDAIEAARARPTNLRTVNLVAIVRRELRFAVGADALNRWFLVCHAFTYLPNASLGFHGAISTATGRRHCRVTPMF
jgi:hypothetical protein